MSVSSHRKLNVEQLINLAQVYWDDPGKLMEIAEAVESRMDPVAQLLFGAMNGRLDRLKNDPKRALAEPTPDLAALIAARLGKKPAEAIEAVADEEEEKTKSRRLPLVLIGVLVIAAVGVWFLWPRAKDEEKAATAGKPGIEIFEQGAVPEEEAKRSEEHTSELQSH